MKLPELKNKVLMYIENADERLLTKVSDIFENEEKTNIVSEPIVAFDVLGKPLTLKQYNDEIDKGIDDIKNRRVISQEDLEKEIESWKNESKTIKDLLTISENEYKVGNIHLYEDVLNESKKKYFTK